MLSPESLLMCCKLSDLCERNKKRIAEGTLIFSNRFLVSLRIDHQYYEEIV